MPTPYVAVIVHVPAVDLPIGPVQLRVQVEDTSEADAQAIVRSRLILEIPRFDGATPQTFRFDLPYTGHAADVTVSATLSSDASGPQERISLVTPVAVPIGTEGSAHVNLVAYRAV